MLRSFVLLVVFTILATLGLGFFFQKSYPFVLASETARKSIQVTPEQSKELNGAELRSDMIAFAIYSAILCGGLSLILIDTDKLGRRVVGLAVGLIVGGVVGAGAGWFGHWFYENPSIAIQETILYYLTRWSLMLAPIAIVTGGICAVAGGNQRQALNVITGAIFGAIAAAVIYAILCGLVTTPEGRDKILPFFYANRILFIAASIFCIGFGIASQLYRKSAAVSKSETEKPAS